MPLILAVKITGLESLASHNNSPLIISLLENTGFLCTPKHIRHAIAIHMEGNCVECMKKCQTSAAIMRMVIMLITNAQEIIENNLWILMIYASCSVSMSPSLCIKLNISKIF